MKWITFSTWSPCPWDHHISYQAGWSAYRVIYWQHLPVHPWHVYFSVFSLELQVLTIESYVPTEPFTAFESVCLSPCQFGYVVPYCLDYDAWTATITSLLRYGNIKWLSKAGSICSRTTLIVICGPKLQTTQMNLILWTNMSLEGSLFFLLDVVALLLPTAVSHLLALMSVLIWPTLTRFVASKCQKFTLNLTFSLYQIRNRLFL